MASSGPCHMYLMASEVVDYAVTLQGHALMLSYVVYSFRDSSLFQTDIQAPLNRQIVRSSEQIMYFVDLMDNMLTTFMGPQDNDLGKTDNRPRYLNNLGYLGEVVNFARTLYNLTK